MSIFRSGVEMVVSRSVCGFYRLFLYESHIVLVLQELKLYCVRAVRSFLHITFIFFNKTCMIQCKK